VAERVTRTRGSLLDTQRAHRQNAGDDRAIKSPTRLRRVRRARIANSGCSAASATAGRRATAAACSARAASATGSTAALVGIEAAEDVAAQRSARSGAHRHACAGLTVEILPVALLVPVDLTIAALENTE
jgi:hypothetical protein